MLGVWIAELVVWRSGIRFCLSLFESLGVGLGVRLGLSVVDVARRAVARASYVAAVGARILARLLYGALDTQTLHVLVGGDLRVDEVTLEDYRDRHPHNEECHAQHRYEYDYPQIRHGLILQRGDFGAPS